MPRIHSSIEKDPRRTRLGRRTGTNAAPAILRAKRLTTGQELAPALSQRNSGRSGGNTTLRLAGNMNGAVPKLGGYMTAR